MLQSLLALKKWMIFALNWALIIAVSLLVFDVVWGVFSRYVMGEQTKWTEELARFLLIWVSLLGGAVAFGARGHLGVDFFVGKFHPQTQKLMAIFVHLVVLFFAGSIFLYGGSHIVSDAFAMEQMTPALGWKMGYIYLALPIAGIFMILFTVENLFETLGKPASSLHEAEAVGEVD
jgi:TRAP-type C4-dicarboxylate transport system permease small subunit